MVLKKLLEDFYIKFIKNKEMKVKMMVLMTQMKKIYLNLNLNVLIKLILALNLFFVEKPFSFVEEMMMMKIIVKINYLYKICFSLIFLGLIFFK